jgi:hypothetical protein
MLLHQIYYGLIHNLVYMAAMTVDFNISMIVSNASHHNFLVMNLLNT